MFDGGKACERMKDKWWRGDLKYCVHISVPMKSFHYLTKVKNPIVWRKQYLLIVPHAWTAHEVYIIYQIDNLITYRNGDRKMVEPIRITSGPTTRIKKYN